MQVFPMDLPRSIKIIMYEQPHCIHGAEWGSCTWVLNAGGILQPVVKGMPENEAEVFLNRLKMLSDDPHALIFHIAARSHSESLLLLFLAAPSFTEELIDQAAAIGQCVTLSCRTAAHSSLRINWFRGDIPLESP